MNLIFAVIFILSIVSFCFISPETALTALRTGGEKAVSLSLNLVAVYSVWSGILSVAEKAGALAFLSKKTSPLVKKFFFSADDESSKDVAVALSANLLGMGGIATPSGIAATTRLCEKNNEKAAKRFLVISCAFPQIFPTTVVTLRQSFGSASPSDVFLPTLLSSIVCFAVACSLSAILVRK